MNKFFANLLSQGDYTLDEAELYCAGKGQKPSKLNEMRADMLQDMEQ